MRRILLYCILQNAPSARVWKGYSSALALATETHICDCASCAISLLSQILSAIQSLPNLHCISSHFSKLMGKYNLNAKAKKLHETQMLKMLRRAGDSPQEGKEQGESRNLSGPVQAEGNFFYQLPEEQAVVGKMKDTEL